MGFVIRPMKVCADNMKNIYFNALYLAALVLLAFLFYMSINVSSAETDSAGIMFQGAKYTVSPWGIVIAIIWFGNASDVLSGKKKIQKSISEVLH